MLQKSGPKKKAWPDDAVGDDKGPRAVADLAAKVQVGVLAPVDGPLGGRDI